MEGYANERVIIASTTCRNCDFRRKSFLFVLLRRSWRNCGAFRVITKLVSFDKQKRRKAERGGWMEGEEEHFCVLRLLACVGVGGMALNSWTFRDFSLLFPTSPSLSHTHHAFCLSIPFHTRIMNGSLCCYTVSAIYVIIKYGKTIVQSQIFTRLNDVPLYRLLLLHLCLCVFHPKIAFLKPAGRIILGACFISWSKRRHHPA